MKRWAGIISDSDGLDAVIQLADDPDAAGKVKEVRKNAQERARIVHALKTGNAPTSSYSIQEIVDSYIKERTDDIIKKSGGSEIGEYMGYNLRKRFANGNLLEVSWAATESQMRKIRQQNPYQGAIDVLNLVLSGKGKTMNPKETEEDVQDYLDIMEMKLKKAKRKGDA